MLTRFISPYTGASLLLGVFRTQSEAEIARREYIQPIQDGVVEDPWAEQGYHRVDLEKDVTILSGLRRVNVTGAESHLFVVRACFEGMGQIVGHFRALCATYEDSERLKRELAQEQDVSYTTSQRVRVGELQ